MIALAVADTPGWEVSDLELTREGPSYTYDTLTALAHQGLTPRDMFFITGADAFAEVATWSRYPDVLTLAHFVVSARPGADLALLRQRLPDLAERMIAPGELRDTDNPRIILLEAETPDISSTTIRRRIADGQSIRGLVPDAVAAYIDQNLLYRSAPAPVAPVAPDAPD